MSDPNVVNSEMNPSNLSDAEIDSIISGTPVAGAPVQLSEFVALLSAEYDATPGVTPGLALADFLSASSVAPGAPGAGTNTVTSIFKKSTAVVGAVSFKILLGAAAAAAGVGGAQAAGVIDLPGLGSEPTGVELPTDPGDGELGPPTSVTADGSPPITVPGGRTSDAVSVPPFAQLAEPENSLEPDQCTPRQGPTHASSTSNPSETNRQASSACSEGGGGPGDRPADDQGNGSASAEDDDQGPRSGSSTGDEDDLEPEKPAKSQKPESPSPSGPKKEK